MANLYCGNTPVGPGTKVCPNGLPPTTTRQGYNPGGQGSDPTLTGQSPFWNQDASPVSVGWTREYITDSNTGEPFHMTADVRPVYQAQDDFNKLYGAAMASDATKQDKQALRVLTAQLQAYTGSELGTRGSLEDAWNTVLQDAARSGKNVYELLGQSGSRFFDSGGSGGSGGYSGPVATTTLMDDRDVDRTANALALELIGRPLSDKELAKVTQRLRTEERANPTVTTPGTGTSLTQSGLSAEGRADVLREVIAENPEYRQFQVDNTVLDTMLSELNKREQMVNG